MTLSVFFQWLDAHPAFYWTLALSVTGALIMAAVSAWRAEGTGSAKPARGWLFPLLLLATLLAWRWPYLLYANELNTDESQYIAGALTLRHDPLFWRSVDGMTAGPLVYYALLPWRLIGLPLDFFAARFVGLVLISTALVLAYCTLRRHYQEGTARLALLPGGIFVASVFSNDLNHYSSELVSLVLTAATITLLSRHLASPSGRLRPWLAIGLLLGLHPWAKWQTIPIAAALGAVALWLVLADRGAASRDRLQRVLTLLGGCALPSLVIIGIVLCTGLWSYFFYSVIGVNFLQYAHESLPIRWNLMNFFINPTTGWQFVAYLTPALLLALLAGFFRAKPSGISIISGLAFGAALFAIYYTRRDFEHYTMLLLVPTAMVNGSLLGMLRGLDPKRSRLQTTGTFILLGLVAASLGLRCSQPSPPVVGQLSEHWRKPREELDEVIRVFANPGEKMAVWGYHAQAYVTNQLIQGTRCAFTYWGIVPSSYRDYDRAVFLADLQQNRPEVFLDAVGPHAIFFKERAEHAHESFPALTAAVQRHYTLVIDIGYARIYARNDLMTQRAITPAKIRQALGRSRPFGWIQHAIVLENLGPIFGTHFSAGDIHGLLLLPPREVAWDLKGDEREIFFECGYHPEALKQKEGNGTQFFIELQGPDGSRRVLRSFLLDPAHNPADHAPKSLHVILPPYETGSKFIVRTTPGADNYDAWDWAYVTNVKIMRSPYYTFRQFPGFNQMPDAVHSPLSGLISQPQDPTLLLHAPSQLDYVLTGYERHLRLTYGFLDQAFQGNNVTDGATFKVELHSPNGSHATVWKRNLQPLSATTDRGPQAAALDLPSFSPGTKLRITVDPNGNNACDWTYVSELQLD